MRKTILFAATALFLASCGNPKKEEANTGFPVIPVSYPETAKDTTVVDDYHGTRVADPYRWLEYDTAANVEAWVAAENKVTFDYLSAIPFREKIKARLTEIFNYPKYSSPFRVGEYYFFQKNDGLQNQSVIYYQKGLDGEPQVFLDPNTMSADGTAAITLLGESKDNKYMAYATNQSGSDWQQINVMEIATRKKLDDQLNWVKFSGAAWQGDGFYYSRYDEPVKGKEFSNKNEYHKICYHKIGTPQSADKLIYENKNFPLRYYGAQTTEDEHYLIIYVSEGTDGTELYCKDLKAGQKDFTMVFKGFDDNATVINNIGDKLIVQTDKGAPNQKVILLDPKHSEEASWETLLPEKDDLLQSVGTAGGKLYATYLKDVTTRAYQYDMSGKQEQEINLPTLGTASGFSGKMDDKELFYTFTSFTYPTTIYKYDIATGKSDVFRKSDVKFNPEDYETKQVFFESKDGTKIPMFIIHKKGLELNGNNPALLYGYGGFNISITPSFSTSRLILLENGGVLAIVNLRGGGEYGEKWHEAGKMYNKQNVFDDCIGAAEYLIKEKYTSADRLALEGRSNGGLLVGAVINQRPDLFKVAFPGVGVMDMLRFHKFTVGWGWAVEYGSSDSLEQFNNLYKYSPLHNIDASKEYPATMVTTADHDDRVVPAHSFKYIATLQEKRRDNKNPLLIRIDVKAGHGAGKPISKSIDELSDLWSFMFYNMNVTPIYK
ncbi:MAG TPA: prolyl oligopeptidase family serine peptidase [Bacteroidia bacterium]|nr:prolyl oligopeptidase family serine peptidase [Bacteroidia bacterium]